MPAASEHTTCKFISKMLFHQFLSFLQQRPRTNNIDTPTEVSSPSTSPVPAEHNYSINRSPRGIKRKCDEILAARERQRSSAAYHMKGVCRKLIRHQKKLKDMSDVVKHLKLQKDINEDAVRLIECFGSTAAEILRDKLASKKNAPYSDVIQSLAINCR